MRNAGAGVFMRLAIRTAAAVALATWTPAHPALARPAFACAGFALLGGAQLVCSHTDPEAPPQSCNFSWSLMSGSGPSIATGAFVLFPGTANATEYQGSGVAYALTSPIVLCQARTTDPAR